MRVLLAWMPADLALEKRSSIELSLRTAVRPISEDLKRWKVGRSDTTSGLLGYHAADM